jgi:CRP-like cAMP-binding protein
MIHSPTQNKILAALPDHEYRRLLPFLELVDMPTGHVVHEQRRRITQVYFPTTSTVARIYELRSGISRRVSMTGNEGVTDIFMLFGLEGTPATVLVQTPGYGYRIKADNLKKEFESGGSLQELLLRFSRALLLQTEQSAVEVYQTVEQRLCCFLLMILDRLSTDSITMTHEFVSNLLGVRRESVSTAANMLQVDGAIKYRRGHITVVNRKLMEDRVHEGYEMLREEYNQLLVPNTCNRTVTCLQES